MRTRVVSLFLSLLALSAVGYAQTGDWASIERLRPGTALSVVRGSRFYCTFIQADDAQLVCEPPSPRFFLRDPLIFDRTTVREIRLEHPVGGTLAGVAVGAAVGIGLGALSKDQTYTRGANETFGALLFGTIGGFVGKHLHPIHGGILYTN